MDTFTSNISWTFRGILFLSLNFCCTVLAEDQCIDSDGTTQLPVSKCMWTAPGGNLSMAETECENGGGTIVTFNTVDEATRILDTLGIDKSNAIFVGAVSNLWNKTTSSDWMSRPDTWPIMQYNTEIRYSNSSNDVDCVVLKNGTLYGESCSTETDISVCEKVALPGCQCANDTTTLSPPFLNVILRDPAPFNSEASTEGPVPSPVTSTINGAPVTMLPTTSSSPPSWEQVVNDSYSEIFDHVRSHANNSDTKTSILSHLFDYVLSHINGTPENLTSSENRPRSGFQNPGFENEDKSVNYSNMVNVLNITFGALIDNIIGNVIEQGCINNNDSEDGACLGTTEASEPSETTLEQVRERTTVPVTEVKFQLVDGIPKGPTMTGSNSHPPLRIDLHSKDYSVLVNVSRDLMEFQLAKQVDNITLKSFAESVTNWTVDHRLVSDTKNVQTDLFEDILQVAEDLVGNITASDTDICVSSGSIDIVSKIVKASENSSHTGLELGQGSRGDITVQLSNRIFNVESIKVRISTVTYTKFDTIAKVVDDRISSSVFSVTVKYIAGNQVKRQTIETKDAIIFDMRTFLHKGKKEQERLCTYWSFPESRWSTTGCSVITKNASFTTCRCNHLTNFAILVMYLDNREISLENQHVLFTLTTVGCSLSIACLAMTLITYIYLRMLGNDKIMIHANLSLALLLAQIVFVSSSSAHNHATSCKVVALLLHFLFMASFTWMMVEGIALYVTCTRGILANVNRDMKVKYFLIGWGVPAVIVVVSCAAQFPSYGDGPQYSCWLSTQNGLIWAFLGPMLVIVVLNIGVMGLVVKVFLTLRTNTEKTELARLRGSLRAMLTLLPLLGLGWILSLLVPISVVFNYFFVIVNTLQGMCIFFLHCICNEEIRKLFREKRRRWSTTRTASDFDVTMHTRRKAGSFDGIKASSVGVPPENGRRHVWSDNTRNACIT